MTRVRFWLGFHVEYGQQLRVVGSHANIGKVTAFNTCSSAEVAWLWKRTDGGPSPTRMPAALIEKTDLRLKCVAELQTVGHVTC